MAQKKITDLQLRSDFDETCNFPVDDAAQTWRVTGQQIIDKVIEDGVAASVQGAPKAITYSDSPYTVTGAEPCLSVSTAGGNVSILFPTAALGFPIEIIKSSVDSNYIDMTPNGAEKINGESTDRIEGQYSNKTYRPIAGGWVIR